MTVWVVIGEYQEVRDGVASWVAGVARTRRAALVIAKQDAALYIVSEAILIDGERWPSAWGKYQPDWRWTLSYSVEEHEVMR